MNWRICSEVLASSQTDPVETDLVRLFLMKARWADIIGATDFLELKTNNLLGPIGLFFAAMLAGAINSVAGGGTLISFPALVAFGLPAILANATNAASLWPGSLSSAFAYREDTLSHRALLSILLVPSFLGSLLGAVILVATPPETFARAVPFLVLFATLLFAAKDWLARLIQGGKNDEECVTWLGRVWGFLFQLFVATYGGYFGAGMGILMLGSMSIMGLRDIHRMNGLKTVLGAVINIVSFVFFAFKGLVVWPLAILMAIGAIVGGYSGARLAKRVDQHLLRWFIILVGLGVSAWLFIR
jgi:uncharacterized membrane protein YfcA